MNYKLYLLKFFIIINILISESFIVFSYDAETLDYLFNATFDELLDLEFTSSTLSPIPIRKAPAIATIVTKDQITKMGARTLLDVVQNIPGFNVSKNNIGNNVIDVRGLKSYHGEKLLLMVDNHRLNESDCGGAAWSFTDMPLDNVERIELIRGPGSALYGENAFSGIINVITMKHKSTMKNFLTISTGSQNTSNGSIFIGDTGEEWSFSGFTRYYETEGFSLPIESDILSLNPLTSSFSSAPGKTDDWQRQKDVDLFFTWKDFSIHSKYLNKKRGPYINIVDALAEGSTREIDHFLTELLWKKQLNEMFSFTVKLFIDKYEYDNYWVGYPAGFLNLFPNGFIGEPKGKFDTYGLEIISDIVLSENHFITIGSSYRQHRQYDIRYFANFNVLNPNLPLSEYQEVSAWGNWASETDHKEYDYSIFAQDDWNISDKSSFIAGVRYDKYKNFGDVISPRLGFILETSDNKTLKLLYGKAFRSPSFVERFTINNPAYIGNPNLKPEIVNTIETSLNGKYLNLDFIASIYYSKFKDIIALGEKTSFNSPALYLNKDEATAKGIELTLSKELSSFLNVLVNYTHQILENDESNESFAGIPSNYGNISFQWNFFDHIYIYNNLYICGDRKREEKDLRSDLAGYQVFDITLLFKDTLRQGTNIRISIRNLFDEKYEDPSPINTIFYDYPKPGINGEIEIMFSF